MSDYWTIDGHESSIEDICHAIKNEMSRPIGILIFGTDVGYTLEIRSQFWDKLDGFTFPYTGSYKTPNEPVLRQVLQSNHAVILAPNDEAVADHRLRHEYCHALRRAGAKTLVGIYVKNHESFQDHPPTPDGLEHFVTVERKDSLNPSIPRQPIPSTTPFTSIPPMNRRPHRPPGSSHKHH